MNRRLLLVDEDVAKLELLSFILCPPPSEAKPIHEPFIVVLAGNKEVAVDHVKRSLALKLPFAGAFVDVGGPATGTDTLIRLRNLDPQIQLVAMTTEHAAQNVGWDLLATPFTETQILQKAHQLISRWEIQRRDSEPKRRAK